MKVSDQTIVLIQMMKEQSREWHDKYIGKLQRITNDENESKILALAANLEKDNEITYVVLQEIIRPLMSYMTRFQLRIKYYLQNQNQ